MRDVNFESFAKSVTLHIRGSKTDQFGHGEQCKIMKTGKKYCAVAWLALYMTQLSGDPEELVFDVSAERLRAKLRKWLIAIGIEPEEAAKYSTHSCRAGGATSSARAGIQDCVIQRHGRWRSSCFMKYTRMERTEAGELITSKI